MSINVNSIMNGRPTITRKNFYDTLEKKGIAYKDLSFIDKKMGCQDSIVVSALPGTVIGLFIAAAASFVALQHGMHFVMSPPGIVLYSMAGAFVVSGLIALAVGAIKKSRHLNAKLNSDQVRQMLGNIKKTAAACREHLKRAYIHRQIERLNNIENSIQV